SDGFDGLSGHFFRLLPIQKKRPEQVGAFAWAFISVFSHSLFGAFFCICFMRYSAWPGPFRLRRDCRERVP
ncbi:hypothetical protein, partial [Pseudomonas cannabina]|uniref:hypothetical protein n=1 Tax=Pseudomonas cannabina TaxID=86840 RepID=UPI001CC316CD